MKDKVKKYSLSKEDFTEVNFYARCATERYIEAEYWNSRKFLFVKKAMRSFGVDPEKVDYDMDHLLGTGELLVTPKPEVVASDEQIQSK